MVNHLWKIALAGVIVKLLGKYRQLSVQLLQIEAAKGYLHGVQVARRAALGLLRIGLCLAVMTLGVLLFHAGLFILLPWSLAAKAIFGMFLGVAYVIVGWVVLRVTLSEKNWIVKSGLAHWLREIGGQTGRE